MSTPIDFKDIRVGDTVECVWYPGYSITGIVGGIDNDGLTCGVYGDGEFSHLIGVEADTFTLVDRPKPDVVLPTVATLGWLDSKGNDHALGIWRRQVLTGGNGVENLRGDGFRAQDYDITDFTPATAVPTTALDELRDTWEVHIFLAAVDAANGQGA